jgi:catalase
MQDFHAMEEPAHFNRERIPEHIGHTKEAGPPAYSPSPMTSYDIQRQRYLPQSEILRRENE